MKKKRFWLLGGMMFSAFGAFALSACGIVPHQPPNEEIPETDQDTLVNNIYNIDYLKADMDISVKYQSEDMDKPDVYHVYGDAYASMKSLDEFAARVAVRLDMNTSDTPEADKLPLLNFDLTYFENFVYLDINNRCLKLKTDKFGEVLDIVLGGDDSSSSSSESTEPQTNLFNSGIVDLISNVANMEFSDKGDHYEYVAKTMANQPDLMLTSDLDHNLTSVYIKGITYQDFTIDIDIKTTVLDALETPITSPETSAKPYVDLSNYFGAFKHIRRILDAEQFAMDYTIELSHYEPNEYDNIKYMGFTKGKLNMDMSSSMVDLDGKLHIANMVTGERDVYNTNYHAQYFNECIYLDYNLNREDGRDYKLSYSNAALSDMWDFLGDDSIFGVNIFDLLFGASGKEYPILDILGDGDYRELAKYGSIDFGVNYLQVNINNVLLGGVDNGYIRINFNNDNITSIVLNKVDINSYIVDAKLTFTDYVDIIPVSPIEYQSIDSLDKLLASGGRYFTSKKYNLTFKDLQVSKAGKTLSIDNDSVIQLNMDDTLAGHAKIIVNDFNNNTHTLKLDSRLDQDDETTQVNRVYASYSYQAEGDVEPTTVNVNASYESILSIYRDVMEAMSSSSSSTGNEFEDNTNNMLSSITSFISNATKDTVSDVLQGDYFAILRDEVIKEIDVTNNVWRIVLDQDMVGFNEDITLELALNDKNELKSLYIDTTFSGYEISGTIFFNEYDPGLSYIDNTKTYTPCDSIAELVNYITNTSDDNGKFRVVDQFTDIMNKKTLAIDFSASVKQGEEKVFTITDGRLDARLNDIEVAPGEDEPSLLDRLELVVSGSVNSDFTGEHVSDGNKHLPLVIGYKYNEDLGDTILSACLGTNLKLYCTKSELNDILAALGQLTENNPLDGLIPSNDGNSVTLPILDMITNKKYQDLLSCIKGISIQGETFDELRIRMSNGLLTEGDTSTFDLFVKIDDTGLKSIKVEGLKYSGFTFDFEATLDWTWDETTQEGRMNYDESASIDVIADNYLHIAHVGDVLDQVNNLISEPRFGLDLDVVYGDNYIHGSADLNLKEHKYAATFDIEGEVYYDTIEDITYEKRDIHHIRIENDGENCYIIYQRGERSKIKDTSGDGVVTYKSGYDIEMVDDKAIYTPNDDAVRIQVSQADIDSIISTIRGMIGNDESYIYEYVYQYLGELTSVIGDNSEEEDSDSGFNVISLIYKDFVIELDSNESVPSVYVELDGEALGFEEGTVIRATVVFNVNSEDKYEIQDIIFEMGQYVAVEDFDPDTSANVTIRDYDPNKHVIDEAEINSINERKDKKTGYGGWVGIGSTNEAFKYLDNLNYATQKACFDQLQDLLDNKTAFLTYDIGIGKKPGGSNVLISTTGYLDLDLKTLNGLDNLETITVGLTNGHIVNLEEGLDATYDLRLVDGVAYFEYKHERNVDRDFKIKYTLTELKDLKDLIYQEAETNPTLTQFINSLFPEGDSSNQTPLNKALSGGNVLSLLNYYKGAFIEDGKLFLSFNGKMIGNESSTINVGFDTKDGKGINGIYIEDFYAMGYYLRGSILINPEVENPAHADHYEVPTAPTNASEYVTLDHLNDIFKDVIYLFGDEINRQVAYDLSITYGKMRLDADIDFLVNQDINGDKKGDYNLGNLNVVFTSGDRTHYLYTYTNAVLYQNDAVYKANIDKLVELYAIPQEDRTEEEKALIEQYEAANKEIVNEAADASNITFAYGDVASGANDEHGIPTHGAAPADANKMYGSFTLGTVGDIYNLVQKLTDGSNTRFANIMEMFSSSGPQSIFSEILGGDIEAFLYNKVVNSFDYDEDGTTQTYTIELNGEIFLVPDEDGNIDPSEAHDLTLTLSTDCDPLDSEKPRWISALGLNGTFNGDEINVSLVKTSYSTPNDINIPSGKTKYDFSSVDDVVDHLLNTVTEDDFVFSGNIKLHGEIAGITFTNKTMGVSAKIHIEDDGNGYENYYAKLSISNIPMLRFGVTVPYFDYEVYYNVSDDRDPWDDGQRTFNIYLQNEVIHDGNGEAVLDENGNVTRNSYVCMEVDYSKGNTHKIKRKNITSSEFMDDLSYYLLNFGLGIKARNNNLPTTFPEDIMEDSNGNPVNKDQDFLNFHNYHEESTYMATYSKLLTSYKYSATGMTYSGKTSTTPTWKLSMDLEELLNNTMLNDANICIVGGTYQNSKNETIKYLQNIYGDTEFTVSIASLGASFDITYDQGQKMSASELEAIQSYVDNWKSTRTYFTNKGDLE